jgi:small subunit ribosomal protein S6
MNNYEFVYIVDAHASQSVKDEVAKQVADAIAKSNIKVVNSQIWLERHKMSFPINKVWEGTYYMLNLEAPGSSMTKLNAILRINENILRYLSIKVDSFSAATALTAKVAA